MEDLLSDPIAEPACGWVDHLKQSIPTAVIHGQLIKNPIRIEAGIRTLFREEIRGITRPAITAAMSGK
jgi:hypothetical protein